MKKSMLFLSAVFALGIQIVNAQTFGIKGGVNFANLSISSGGVTSSPKSLTGFHIGPVAEFKLKESLFLNTGLLYSLKGFKIEEEVDLNTTVTNTDKINYLEIPLYLAYKFPFNEKSKFFIQAGPYLGYGLSGNIETGGENLDPFSADGGMKRWDYGLGFGAGVEFGKLVASVNYQLGLANLLELEPMDSEFFDLSDLTMKNKVFQISLAYMFGKKK